MRAFHNQMTATVSIASEETVPFDVGVGVKQGCVMAPVIFNVFLAAASYFFLEFIRAGARSWSDLMIMIMTLY